jgi:protein-disulfide isomerase
MGVRGTSYNNGETQFTYPNPAQPEDGNVQWLPALGEEDAPVVVMEFSDIYCGHCRTFHFESLGGILEDYVAQGDVRYVDHYFGFAQSMTRGVVEAEMCAAEQGRYFEFKHALFQTLELGDINIQRAAQLSDVDMQAFNTCLRDQRYKAAAQEMAFVDNREVRGTPTFFVNGQKVEGNAPDQIRQLIESALAGN